MMFDGFYPPPGINMLRLLDHHALWNQITPKL